MILNKYRLCQHFSGSSLLFLIMFFCVGKSVLAINGKVYSDYFPENHIFTSPQSGGAVNAIPSASNDEATTQEDQLVSFSIVENDADSEGLLLANTVDLDVSAPGIQSVFELAGEGTFTSDGAGNVTFAPSPDFFGTTTPFFYTIQDDEGETSNQASIKVNVLQVNDSPVFTKGADQSVCVTDEVSSVSVSWASGIQTGPANESYQTLSFVVTSISDPSIFVDLPEISASGVLSFAPVRSANGSAVISVLLKDDGGTDNGGADMSAEQTFTITVKSVNVSGNVANISCNGVNDGKIDLVVNGGTPPYTYLWNDQSSLSNRSNLAPGNYRVEVTDSEGCSAFAEFVVTEPGILGGTLVKTDITCFGGSDGNVSVILPSGGSGNYEFSINGGQSWQLENIFNGLSAGNFTVLIRDAIQTSCYKSLGRISVSQPEKISVLAVITPCSCIGSSTGAIDLTVTGSTGSYRYDWSNGATTQNLTGIPSGPYSVIVSDENNCSSSGLISFYVEARNNVPVSVDKILNIDEDAQLNGNLSVGDLASCDGGNVWSLRGVNGGAQNGAVTLNADGSFLYVPNPNFYGSDEFSYSLCDVNGDCSIARVTMSIKSVNDLPVAENDVFITDEDVPIFGRRVFDNDLLSGDGENTWSLFGPNGGALNGKVTMYPDGTFDYIPAPDFNGSDYFIYKLCDRDGDCEAALVTIILNSVGDIPYAFDDVISTNEEVPIVAGSVATNDKASGDGGNSWSLFGSNGGAQHGKVTMNGSGEFTYMPDVDFTGTDSFIYFICDNDNDCTAAIVTISVLPVNDNPTAKGDIGVTLKGYALAGNLLTNDRDVDSDQLTINIRPAKNPDHGSVVINTDGTYIYTPDNDYFGSDSFAYEVCDNGQPSLCDQAEMTIAVADFLQGNNEPVAVADNFQGSQGMILNGNVLANDFDPDKNLNLTSVTVLGLDPANGSLQMQPNGKFVFSPNAGFTGKVSFQYRVCDNGMPGLCSVGNVTIEILPNPAKSSTFATDDCFAGLEDIPITGNVLSNDVDPQGNNQQVSVNPVKNPDHGTMTIAANGVFTFVPDADFNGSDWFVYEVCDDGNPKTCNTATVRLIVLPRNDAPVAKGDIGVTFKNLAFEGDLLVNDYDVDQDTLNINAELVSGPAHGTVVIQPDGKYRYVPESNFTGEDSFIYGVCDNGEPRMCDQGIVSLEVVNVESSGSKPVANADIYQGAANKPVVGNVISNDFNPDSKSFSGKTVWSPVFGSGSLEAHTDGTFVYTPLADFSGRVNFNYGLRDADLPGVSDVGTVTIEILRNQKESTQYPTDDVFFGASDTVTISGNLFLNDNDLPGNLKLSGTVPLVSPKNGILSLGTDGNFTYVPNEGFFGHDQFVYEVCDGNLAAGCRRATVHLLVGRINHPPLAQADQATTFQNTSVSGNLLANDSDPDGNNISISLEPATGPFNGKLTIQPDGTYNYIPNPGFTGVDNFTYNLCDDGLPVLCSKALVTINVIVNPNPNKTVAVDDQFSGVEGTRIAGNVLSNDFDREGDRQTVNILPVTKPAHGVLTLSSDGSFIYMPQQGFSGTDSFIYEVCDSGQPVACSQAKVTLEVIASDKLPVATADAVQTNEDSPWSGNVAANDVPGDGANFWTIVSLPENGMLTMTSFGIFAYTPDQDFNGTDSFVYRVCDADGDCSTATVTILVNSVNDLPVAVDDQFVMNLDAVLTGDVSLNDESGDGGNSWTVVRRPSSGNLVLNQDGTFTYTPNVAFGGADSFTYRLCDANGDCDEALVQIEYEDVVEPNQVLTPNDDGKNDTFIIEGIENYPVNSLTIFNRWGSVVYTKKGYQNEWNGNSNKNTVGGSSLPAGTYFYVLDYGNNRHKTGYVYLDR